MSIVRYERKWCRWTWVTWPQYFTILNHHPSFSCFCLHSLIWFSSPTHTHTHIVYFIARCCSRILRSFHSFAKIGFSTSLNFSYYIHLEFSTFDFSFLELKSGSLVEDRPFWIFLVLGVIVGVGREILNLQVSWVVKWMGSIRGVKKRKKVDNKEDATATPLYSQLHQPLDWWHLFSQRISGYP